MGIKIFKSANKMSIMDVFPELNYYKENKYGEKIYKGSIRFLINEYGGSKLIKSAYVPKSEAKYFCREVLNNTLEKYEHFGGSNKNGIIIARVFSIKRTFKDNIAKYIFEITEGPGYINNSGGYALSKNSGSTVKVQKFLSLEEMKIMSGELLDFINQSEILALQAGNPLYTITKNDDNSVPEPYQQSVEKAIPTNNVNSVVEINGVNLDLEALNVEQLSQLILNVKPSNPQMTNLLELAKFTLNRKQQQQPQY